MISLDEVMNLHYELEDLKLCRPGILHPDLLESAIAGQQWYESTFDKYVHVASSINSNHIFNDGNKRICYMVIKELSKYGYYFDNDKLSDLILLLAKSKITKDQFMSQIKDCIYKPD